MKDIFIAETGSSDNQHIADIVKVQKGGFKFEPQMGVGIDNYTNNERDFFEIKNAIDDELIKDGADAISIEYKDNTINLNANYNG